VSEGSKSKGISPGLANEWVMDWMAEHEADLRQSVEGQGILYQTLAFSCLLGLAAHIGGYVLLTSSPGEPLGLFADLLHALGWSLWTGVVVVVLVQVIPEVKRRQIKQALDEYDAFQRDKARAGGHR